MRNQFGERVFRTYQGWRRAVLAINPNAKFDGDKDICCVPGIGEWDGAEGVLYKQRTPEPESCTREMLAWLEARNAKSDKESR